MTTSSSILQSVNPATGEIIRSYGEIDEKALDEVLFKVDFAQKKWMDTPFPKRSEAMKRASDILRKNADPYSRLMAREMGKPLSQGKAEIEKCAWVCDYYAENAKAFLQDEMIRTEALRSYIHYQPIGVVFAIMPWNFPFWQVFRFAAAAIMAGNGVALKHSENTTGCALEIEKIFMEANFPEDLFRSLLITRNSAEQVIRHPVVKAVTLTGSINAGRSVASIAGSALKKTVLELGGSDPYIVLADANIDDAADKCVRSRLLNSGQTCISGKRFIVVNSVYDEFIEKFVRLMASKTMGNPLDNPDVGPQARFDLRNELQRQVNESADMGAKILLGGKTPETAGFFYPPTVLAEVTRDMPVFFEETFGPVAAVIRAADETTAFQIANDSAYGLGAAIFTSNIEKGEQLAREKLDAGSCFVNDFVKSDPRLPFGGLKNSGYGRELSANGIREFINIKTIYVDTL
jgi:succinate-semialdehyde dehydrogenase / glutarate-semialdehyde dehydrogenase